MEAENCSVCLNDLADEPGDCSKLIASLEPCKHAFHDGCIQTWLKTFSSCPICRRKVEAVRVSNEVGGPTISSYEVGVAAGGKAEVGSVDWLESLECEICGLGDNDDALLICDGCELSWHRWCIGVRRVPEGDWFCKACVARDGITQDYYDEHDDVPRARHHAAAAGDLASGNPCASREANHRRFQQIVSNYEKRKAQHTRPSVSASPSSHRSSVDPGWRGRWQSGPERSAAQRSRHRPLSLQTQGDLYSTLDAQERHGATTTTTTTTTTTGRNREPRKGRGDGAAGTASDGMSPESPEIQAAWRALELARQDPSGAAGHVCDEKGQADKPERPRKRPQTRRVPEARPTAADSGSKEAREVVPGAEAGRDKRKADDDGALAESQDRPLKRPLTKRRPVS